uniref:methylmalonyl Co-A mutase-associated GTPase MeaB n=1 Tax=Flavobacterium sp. TaxID=239 RepID=UPI0040499B42
MELSSSNKLNERAGIAQPVSINNEAIEKIRALRKIKVEVEPLVADILAGNISGLSRGITLLESTNPNDVSKAQQLIQACLPFANQSFRIGITGVPGVGKSTFIETFGTYLTEQKQKKVAVLAIDPSSSMSGGSILGDKTRMEALVKNPNAYIRPSASGESLGGVARKTRESILLCEAAGFDTIIIETVGVGQSETAVHSMVDFFLLLKISGAGDELQGIKRGIMEMADAIVINKADGDNLKKAKMAQVEFNRALHLFPSKKSDWQPPVSTCSALTNLGIDAVWETLVKYQNKTIQNGYWQSNRTDQNQYWMLETIHDQLKSNFYQNPKVIQTLDVLKTKVGQSEISPFAAAQDLLQIYFDDK